MVKASWVGCRDIRHHSVGPAGQAVTREPREEWAGLEKGEAVIFFVSVEK